MKFIEFNDRITKIMKIELFNARIMKIIFFLEFHARIMKIIKAENSIRESLKIIKIIGFHVRIMNITKILEFIKNHENYENYTIPYENHEHL